MLDKEENIANVLYFLTMLGEFSQKRLSELISLMNAEALARHFTTPETIGEVFEYLNLFIDRIVC